MRVTLLKHLLRRSPSPGRSAFARSFATGISEDNIVRSKLPDLLPFASEVSIPELLYSSASTLPDSLTTFECASTGSKYTRLELFRNSQAFGAALLKSGIRRGDIVGLILPNCPEYAIVSLGLLHAGIVASYMNPIYTAGELKLLLDQAPVAAIVTLPVLANLVNDLRAQSCGSSIRHVITLGSTEGCHNFFEMLKTDSTGVDFTSGPKINPKEDTAVIFWSSGTTGPPKGTMLTHTNICCTVLARSQPQVSKFTPGEETLVGIIPFFHIFGSMAMLFSAIYHGAKVASLPKFDPALFVKLLQVHRPTYMHLVPPLVSFVASNPLVTKESLENVHTVVCGGAPSGSVLINKFLNKAEKYVFFQEGYGMTETTGLSHVLLQEHRNDKIKSIGPPVANTSCKIVEPETGKTLGPMEDGEICIKGPQVMKGYLNNEEATKNTIDSDGWLHTGDVGHYTEEGLFYIVDRIKELIKVKGLQVSPTELECILRKHDGIADVAVIGIPDERAGELPRAYIVPKNNSVSAQDINEFLKDQVSAHKQLKGGIEFVESIPKSASGKCLRRVILDNYKKSLK